MNRGVAVFFGIVLVLLALLTGGCSIVFSGFIFGNGGDPGLFLIWFAGLAVAALSLWIAVRLLRGPGQGPGQGPGSGQGPGQG